MSMKRLFLFLPIMLVALLWAPSALMADETVTVTATNADISENLDLKMVATLFGQAKDLAEFEQMLNNPDSAFSNLDLNGDGDVDYLRVVETADQNRHLVVIQAVLAKDVYQDVASIFVEKDPESESVTVQVIGDEYIYGDNYIIEPVYIYRPIIYDWFWGPSWVCWHSPYYWGYWPGWWHPYHCIAYHLYWDHMYWHHHYHPICTYRTGHHYHAHYQPMRRTVSRTDYAARHPERAFATRNASRNYQNARDIDRSRTTAMRTAAGTRSVEGATRVSSRGNTSRTFGSTNVRTNDRITAATRNNATRVESASARSVAARNASVTQTTTRSQSVTTRTNSTPSRSSSLATSPRRSGNTVSTPTRSTSTVNRVSNVSTATRSASAPSVNRSSSSSMRTSSSSAVRSSSSSSMRSSGGAMHSSGSSSMRSSGGGSSRGGGSTRR